MLFCLLHPVFDHDWTRKRIYATHVCFQSGLQLIALHTFPEGLRRIDNVLYQRFRFCHKLSDFLNPFSRRLRNCSASQVLLFQQDCDACVWLRVSSTSPPSDWVARFGANGQELQSFAIRVFIWIACLGLVPLVELPSLF